MDWDKIRVFYAVAEAGSFTKATDVLNMSQPAVSRQISALETDLCSKLFTRHARGLLLTEQGELLFETAQEIFNKIHTVKSLVMDSKDKPFGELKITTTVALGASWLTPRLHEFRELYPDINLHLILEDAEMDIGRRQADAAIRLHEPTQNGLIRKKLFTVHLHAYASKAYLEKRGEVNNLDDLDNHDILSFAGNFHPIQELNWLEHTNQKGKKRKPVFKVNNLLSLSHAASEGMGIAILPDYMARHDKNLVQVLGDEEVPKLSTYFVYPEELKSSTRLRVFKEFVVAKSREWSF